jgi:DNA polymerase-3 subunit alpha
LEDLTPLKGKEVSIAGMVTDAQHRLTQNGKQFGSFSLEDYKGKVALILWQDDYIKWKQYIENGLFLFVKAKVNQRYNSETFELKVTQMLLLSSIRDRLAHTLTLRIPLKDASEEIAQHINHFAAASPGACALKLYLNGMEDNMSLELLSKKIKLNLSNEFIKQVQGVKGVSMKVN